MFSQVKGCHLSDIANEQSSVREAPLLFLLHGWSEQSVCLLVIAQRQCTAFRFFALLGRERLFGVGGI
jgi:hypothetical protein